MVRFWLLLSVPGIILQEGIQIGCVFEGLTTRLIASLLVPDIERVIITTSFVAMVSLKLVVELL